MTGHTVTRWLVAMRAKDGVVMYRRQNGGWTPDFRLAAMIDSHGEAVQVCTFGDGRYPVEVTITTTLKED